jgi:hypothetical protein
MRAAVVGYEGETVVTGVFGLLVAIYLVYQALTWLGS